MKAFLANLLLAGLVWGADGPALPLQPAPDSQEAPAVAASSNSFFIVWGDKRTFSETEYDIYGARVSFTGELLDPRGIPICTRPERQENPSVAFDGENFLVVWWHAADDGYGVFGARVTPEGHVLDPGGFRITSTNVLPTEPRVASNGRNFFVVWPDWHRHPNVIADVYGTPVSKNGTVANPDGIPLYVGPWWQIPERIVSANGEYFVVFFNDPSPGGLFWGMRVSEDGTVLTPGAFPISSEAAVDGPGLGTDGHNYFVAWTDGRVREGDNIHYGIYGTLVTGDGQVASPGGVRLVPETYPVFGDSAPAVGWDGREFILGWLEALDRNTPDFYAAKLTATGALSTPSRFGVSVGPGTQRYQQFAFGQGNYLAVWVDGRSEPDNPYPFDAFDIYGTLISPAGEVASPDGTLISTAPPPPPPPQSPVAIIYSQDAISPNNKNATVHLDGSGSYDPNGGPLTYQWFNDGASVPAGTDVILDATLAIGSHTVLLDVANGFDHASATATVNVISASDATLALLRKVSQSDLRPGIKSPLRMTLSYAIQHFQRGRFTAGDMALAEFQSRVRLRVQPTQPALAAELIRDAQRIRDALQHPKGFAVRVPHRR